MPAAVRGERDPPALRPAMRERPMATSTTSFGEATSSIPAPRQAARIEARSLASAPVCERAARGARLGGAAGEQHDRRARVEAALPARANSRPSRKSSR